MHSGQSSMNVTVKDTSKHNTYIYLKCIFKTVSFFLMFYNSQGWIVSGHKFPFVFLCYFWKKSARFFRVVFFFVQLFISYRFNAEFTYTYAFNFKMLCHVFNTLDSNHIFLSLLLCIISSLFFFLHHYST